MKNRCLPLVPLFAVLPGALAQPSAADTLQDFDNLGTPYELTQYANLPAPTVLPGGPTGNFLRLAFDVEPPDPPNHNTIAFVRTDPGPACAVHAELRFRVAGLADGFSFTLLDTSAHGPAGPAAPPLPPQEEPNYARALGFGFDVFQNPEPGDPNDNHLSVHFDGEVKAQIDAGSVDLNGGGWIHAEIDIDLAAGEVSLIALTPDGGSAVLIATDLPVSGLEPYEARVHFGARSGGLDADHDLDEIAVTFTPCPPQRVGAWSSVEEWPLVAIHAHLLPTGEVMFWDRHDVTDGDERARAAEIERTAEHGTDEEPLQGIIIPRLWDPTSGDMRLSAAPPFDLFCSGHTQLADGRLFVAGGHVVDNVGLADAAIYDPFADTWIDLPDMAAGRWYPTATTLASGNVLMVSGDIALGMVNELPEVWEIASGTWRPLPGALKALPLYPFMHLLPDGRVLTAGPQTAAEILDTSGSGSWSPLAGSNAGVRDYGSAVMLADGRLLILGGGDPPTATAEVIAPSTPARAWSFTAPMSYARRQLDATLLPDGTVLVTGGTGAPGFNNAAGEVLTSELYDPETDEWSLLEAGAVRRIYHSTALLLPDARVLVAGGGHPPGDGVPPGGSDVSHFDAEIYSPPYLFRGPRPAIDSVPQRVFYGETFTVGTPDADAVADVTWLRPASVTHAFNQNQRINRLGFTVTGSDTLEVSAPADPERCPPGYHMLFLIDGEGVPSEAAFVQILRRDIFADGFESGDTTAWSKSTP